MNYPDGVFQISFITIISCSSSHDHVIIIIIIITIIINLISSEYSSEQQLYLHDYCIKISFSSSSLSPTHDDDIAVL